MKTEMNIVEAARTVADWIDRTNQERSEVKAWLCRTFGLRPAAMGPATCADSAAPKLNLVTNPPGDPVRLKISLAKIGGAPPAQPPKRRQHSGSLLGKVSDWVADRPGDFTARQLGEAFGITAVLASKYIWSLSRRGEVEQSGKTRPKKFRRKGGVGNRGQPAAQSISKKLARANPAGLPPGALESFRSARSAVKAAQAAAASDAADDGISVPREELDPADSAGA